LLVQGRVDESVEYVKRGRELDPLSPVAASFVPPHLFFAHRYNEAIEEGRKASELFPELPGIYGTRRDALWLKGQYEEAIAVSRLLWKGDDELLKALDRGYAKNGPKGAMRAVAETLAIRARTKSVGPLGIAGCYAMTGAVDPAMEWLERAYREREPFLAHLKADPSYDPLRSDPRFQDLLRRIGFPK
jgi:tetratricopeptide (TPR) repeat protein